MEEIDAGRRFLAEFDQMFPVQAAFWLKDGDEGRWNLYVTSDRINDGNFQAVYGELLRIAGMMRDPNFDPFRVKVVGTDSLLAHAAMDLLRHYPGSKLATRFRRRSFGDVGVEEGSIYPAPIAAP